MTNKDNSRKDRIKKQNLIKEFLKDTPFSFWAKDSGTVSIFDVNQKWLENNEKAMNGEIISEEIICDVDGREHNFHQIIAPVKDAGEIIGTIEVKFDISDYKQVDEALKSEDIHKTFFSQSAEGIYRMELEKPVSVDLPVDEQVNLIYKYCYIAECNDSMAKMYGYEKGSDMVGMRLTELHDGPDNPVNIEANRNFINSNYRIFDIETEEVDKFSSKKYYSNSAIGIIENSHLVRFWGTQSDITEKKKNDIALRESEEKFRLLTEHSTDSIAVHSQGKIVYVNEAGKKLFGAKDAKDLIGKPVMDFVHPDFKEIVSKRIHRSQIENKLSDVLEEKFITLDGRIIDVEVTAIPFLYNGIQSSQVIIRDISDRIRDEKIKSAVYKISELVHSIQTLDELYSSVHKIISGLMPANNFYIALYDDQAGLIEFPYFVDEYDTKPPPKKPGRGLTEYVLRTGKPLLASPEVFETLLEQGEVESIGAVSIDWLGVPLKIKDKTIGILTVQTYTEGIRYHEHEKDILNFISEQIAMSISAKKTEEELTKAKNAAEETSRLKSTLLANMSHELRTPMNGILGFAEILLDDTNDPYVKEMVQNIYYSGKRLMKTLNSIMDLSQFESSSDILNFSEFDINEEVYSVIKSFIPVANQKNIYLNTVYSQTFRIFSDKNLIQQIITNLIDNALKFTYSGGVTVEVNKIDSLLSSKIEIRVRDTGIGIAKEHQKMIFEEFRQVSEGLGRSHEGSGLGLTLTLKMVHMLKGTITVESSPMQGSLFTVIIPLAESDKSESAGPKEEIKQISPVEKKIPEEPEQLPLVLLAEDNELNIQLIKISLKSICIIDATNNATDAVKMAKDRKYEAVLMDINLGKGMDGLKAVDEIRKLPGYKETPIIAVTGYALKGDRELMIEGGCTDYIPKPFDRETIENMMKKILFGI